MGKTDSLKKCWLVSGTNSPITDRETPHVEKRGRILAQGRRGVGLKRTKRRAGGAHTAIGKRKERAKNNRKSTGGGTQAKKGALVFLLRNDDRKAADRRPNRKAGKQSPTQITSHKTYHTDVDRDEGEKK